MRRALTVVVVMTALVLAIVGTGSIAMAAKPTGPVGPGDGGAFLCPAVGNETAASHNGQGWGPLPEQFEGSYTFLPGNNQSGAHANPNGYGAENPDTSTGPGNGNSGWGPIWPGATLGD
jgi:hypothetical protein